MSFDLADYLHTGASRPAFASASASATPRAQLTGRLLVVAGALQGALAARPAATRVLVTCQRRASFAVALLGAWQAGLAVELPPDAEASTLERLGHEPEVLSVLDDAAVDSMHHTPMAQLRRIEDAEPLVLLHTSGSTAAPRRFVKSARALLGEVEALYRTFGDAPATFLATVPPQHLYGLLFGILLPLRRGATVVDAPTLFPEDVLAALRTHEVTVLVSTPTHLRALTTLPRPWPRGLTVLTSSAPLPPALHESLAREQGWIVHDVFGSTETGGVATRSKPGAHWRPLAGVVVRADEPDGYLEVDSTWTSVARADDRVRMLDDGTFEHLGRHGHVAKVGGKRVDVDVMETALRRIPHVTDAAVLVQDDPLRGSRLVAFVAGLPADAADVVRVALATEFDAVLIPRRIILGPLPREESGKLRRARLEALLDRKDERELELVLRPDSAFFRGHFGSAPVYPGAATLADLAAMARSTWPELGRILRLQRVRFQKPLGPDVPLRVLLRRAGATVHFEVRLADGPDGAAPAVTGRLEFARYSGPERQKDSS